MWRQTPTALPACAGRLGGHAFMFEKKYHGLLPVRLFLQRVAKHLLLSALIVAVALGLGVLGYHYTAGFNWVDSLLNAAMILTGMGPVGELKTTPAKLFATFYALFSGLVFVTITGLTLAPALHRFLHKFHLAEEEEQDSD